MAILLKMAIMVWLNQSGIKYFTSWELILSAKNFARNSRQKIFKILLIWVLPWQEISSCNRKFLAITRSFFLWQEVSSCDKKFPPVTNSFFLWQEIFNCGMKFLLVTKRFFLWQEISASYKKFLPMTRKFFLWQEISALIRYSFLWQEISSCGNWLLAVPRCLFLWQKFFFLHVVCRPGNNSTPTGHVIC